MCQTRARSPSETSFWPTQPLGLLRSRSNSAAISGGHGDCAVPTGFLSNVVMAMAFLLGHSCVGSILATFARSQTGIDVLQGSGGRHALVIGGSMSGLFVASLLARAGWRAEVYERAEAELSGRGAGIVTHAAMRTVLEAAGCDPSRDLGIAVAGRKTLDRSGAVIGRHHCPQTLTSWDRVFRMLRESF